MTVRITIACPAARIADANQLALAIGLSLADDKTYGAPGWQDASGNLYACASHDVRPEWLAAAQSQLVAPPWGCDMAAAARAQALIVFDPNTPTIAAPDRIAVTAGPPLTALVAMGLTTVPEEGA